MCPIETYISKISDTADTQMRVCMFFRRFSCAAFFRAACSLLLSAAP